MALTTDKGHLYTWGLGDYGKFHGDTTPALSPRHLEFFRAERLVWAAGGSFHSAAVVELRPRPRGAAARTQARPG